MWRQQTIERRNRRQAVIIISTGRKRQCGHPDISHTCAKMGDRSTNRVQVSIKNFWNAPSLLNWVVLHIQESTRDQRILAESTFGATKPPTHVQDHYDTHTFLVTTCIRTTHTILKSMLHSHKPCTSLPNMIATQ